MTKKSSDFFKKKQGDAHQLPSRVTPALVMPLPFHFLQLSEARFVHFLLQQSPHAVINWIQIWRIWGPLQLSHVRVHVEVKTMDWYSVSVVTVVPWICRRL